jgi:hypothetical protein
MIQRERVRCEREKAGERAQAEENQKVIKIKEIKAIKRTRLLKGNYGEGKK